MDIVKDPKKLLTTALNVGTKWWNNNNNNVESNSTLAKVGNAALEFVGEIKRLETPRNNYLSIYFFIKYLTYVNKKEFGQRTRHNYKHASKGFFCTYS